MRIGWIVLFFVLVIIDRIIQKKFPKVHKRLEFPATLVSTVLLTAYCGLLVYAVYEILTSEVSLADKIFFAIFIGVILSIYVAILVMMWVRWSKGRPRK